MTKLEELRAALLLSADAPWMRKVHTASERYSVWAACGTDREHQIAGDMNEHNAVFIQRAHNLMPTLLEAVDLLKEADADFGYNRSQEKRLETSLNIERFVREKLK